jgi:predicted GNAT family N-acyltransferase
MNPADTARIIDASRQAFPGLTRNSVIENAIRYNPDCGWTIARRRPTDAESSVTGYVLMLPLTPQGLELLARGALNTADPAHSLICRRGERPAGIYVWGVYLPGLMAGGFSLYIDEISRPPYDGINLYSRPNTPAGVRFNQALGFVQGAKIGPVRAPHLYQYNRAPVPPLYATRESEASATHFSVSVARTMEDFVRVLSVRSAVYIGEQTCPYEEEFDGNDMASSHLLAYAGNDPVGCIRIHCFADFAKVGRLAVRKEFRHAGVARQLVEAAIELCRMKGYRCLYAQSQIRLVDFWRKFGFETLEGGRDLAFSDFDYAEMAAAIDPHPGAVKIGADPYVIIRPEGRWHIPGVLEASAARGVTRPSVGT